MNSLIAGALTLFAITAFSPAHAQQTAPVQKQICKAVAEETCQIANQLGRGINMGDLFESIRDDAAAYRLDAEYIDKISGVFKTVRLPVSFSNHAAPSVDGTLDAIFASRIDIAVDSLLAKGFYVILDMHGYNALNGQKPAPKQPTLDMAVVDERFVNIWRQIAERYKDKSSHLVFELFNEPHGRLDGEPWNKLSAEALATVRMSNPTRTVIIGPTNYNNVPDLIKLRLPADRNLIVSFHSYEPFNFTHQGVSWTTYKFPTGITCCDDNQKRLIVKNLNAAQEFSRNTGYPLHIGEFGSYSGADMESRANYTRFMRDELEKRGIGWTYWSFFGGFGVYDKRANQWVEPLRNALLD